MPPAKFKPKRDKSNHEKREKALTRLENRWRLENEEGEWEPESEPVITRMLESVDGGIPYCIEALRAHFDADAHTFLEWWDGCTKVDHSVLTIEEIAPASGVGSLRLAEVIQTAIFLYGQMQTKMILAAGLPKIVATSVKHARTAKGLFDREMMLKAGGILPTPKGATIAIQNNFQPEKDEEKPSGHQWKYPEDRLKEIVQITNPKQLEAAGVGTKAGELVHFDANRPMVFER